MSACLSTALSSALSAASLGRDRATTPSCSRARWSCISENLSRANCQQIEGTNVMSRDVCARRPPGGPTLGC